MPTTPAARDTNPVYVGAVRDPVHVTTGSWRHNIVGHCLATAIPGINLRPVLLMEMSLLPFLLKFAF